MKNYISTNSNLNEIALYRLTPKKYGYAFTLLKYLFSEETNRCSLDAVSFLELSIEPHVLNI